MLLFVVISKDGRLKSVFVILYLVGYRLFWFGCFKGVVMGENWVD